MAERRGSRIQSFAREVILTRSAYMAKEGSADFSKRLDRLRDLAMDLLSDRDLAEVRKAESSEKV